MPLYFQNYVIMSNTSHADKVLHFLRHAQAWYTSTLQARKKQLHLPEYQKEHLFQTIQAAYRAGRSNPNNQSWEYCIKQHLVV